MFPPGWFGFDKYYYRGSSPYANFITVNFITVNFITANFITAIFQKFPNIQLIQNLANATFSQKKKLLQASTNAQGRGVKNCEN